MKMGKSFVSRGGGRCPPYGGAASRTLQELERVCCFGLPSTLLHPNTSRYTCGAMLARIHSFVLVGIDPLLCEVEVDVSKQGMEKITVVGLAQAAVKESMERVRRAIINSGYPFPGHRLLVNLAPADVKKEGPSLDLPMAIGLLRGTNCIQTDRHKEFLIAGELALDGRLRKIKGALSLALLAKHKKFTGVILPQENAREAAVVEGLEVYPMETLSQVVSFLNEQLPLEPFDLDGEAY